MDSRKRRGAGESLGAWYQSASGMVARRDGETRTSRRPNRGRTGAAALKERYEAAVGGKPHPS
jgi:hypothetical protein